MHKIFHLFLLVLSMVGIGMAKGTPANTPIANQAQIAYVVGGIDSNLSSNTDTFVVDRIVDVHVDWQDSAPVQVSAGDSDRVLTFRVTNEGNGDDNLTLTYEHNTTSDFTPQNVHIFQDTNGNGHYDPGIDTPVTTLPNLGADANVTLFLVGAIPDDNTTAPGKSAHEILHAASESHATAGADNPSAVDVVVRKGTDADQGTWIVRDYWLTAEKSATVHSDDNTTHTGTRVTYTITYYIDGNAAGKTIQHVVLTDAIPPNTRYVAGSLTQDGAPRTDAADGDSGQCDGSTVQVHAGTLSGATHHQITFDVEIK